MSVETVLCLDFVGTEHSIHHGIHDPGDRSRQYQNQNTAHSVLHLPIHRTVLSFPTIESIPWPAGQEKQWECHHGRNHGEVGQREPIDNAEIAARNQLQDRGEGIGDPVDEASNPKTARDTDAEQQRPYDDEARHNGIAGQCELDRELRTDWLRFGDTSNHLSLPATDRCARSASEPHLPWEAAASPRHDHLAKRA